MFWAKRFKEADGGDAAWSIAYGDLMSLLLAVFVMIAAMSQLRADRRFGKVRQAVQGAFGFAFREAPEANSAPASAPARPLTLVDRLEQAGFTRRSAGHLVGPDNELLAPCDVIIDGDTVMIRLAGHVCFAKYSAALEPGAMQAVARLAELLADGHARIEVRGHAGDGMLPPSAAFQDSMDLSYARGRLAAAVLLQSGVDASRICVTAWGDSRPLSTAEERSSGALSTEAHPLDGSDRRIELVVHAVLATGHGAGIADKKAG